jgi:hypothetical protein
MKQRHKHTCLPEQYYGAMSATRKLASLEMDEQEPSVSPWPQI